MARDSRITSDIDFDLPGKQLSFLRLPHSVHRSAYGYIAIPIVVINNGSGPSVLITAGNHGDEYEGQLTVMKLSQEVQADEVQGRLILVPSLNFPAATAGLRTSPIDGLNLNRSFPGDPDGQPTAAIAHYAETVLLTVADYAMDLHSGGSSLLYLPSALARVPLDDQLAATQQDMLKAFAAPISYQVAGRGEDRTMIAAATRAGVAIIGTELGGAGGTTVHSLAVAESGVRRVLKHLGSVPEINVSPAENDTRFMEVGGAEYYVYSPEYGIWEPLAELGDEVSEGQPAARVYCPETPWREPLEVNFERSGHVICKRVPGGVHRGDCLFHLATDVA